MKIKSLHTIIAHSDGEVRVNSVDGTSVDGVDSRDEMKNYMAEQIELGVDTSAEFGQDIISITFIVVPA